MDLSARFLGFTTYGVQWVLWLLIALSVISIAMMLERLWFFATYHPSPQALARAMRQLLQSGGALGAGASGPLPTARLAEALDGALEGARARERLRMERNLAFLGTLGSNAPFIGLFGTVLGIIKAFHDLAGNQAGGPAVVMAGISEALVATAVGLMVAIPAVVAFNYFNRRTRTRMTEVDWMSQLALVDVKGDYAEGEAATANAATPSVGPAVAATQPLRALIPVAGMGGVILLGLGVLLGRTGGPTNADSSGNAATGFSSPAPNPIPVPGPAATPAATMPIAPVLPASPTPPPSTAPTTATPTVAATASPPTAPTTAAPLGVMGPPATAAPLAAVPAAAVVPPPAPANAGPAAGAAAAKPGAVKWGKRKRWRPAGAPPAAASGTKPTDAPATGTTDAARDAEKSPAKDAEKAKEKESPSSAPAADKPTPAPAVP